MRYILTILSAAWLAIGSAAPGKEAAPQVNYSEHIASIIYNKCTPCHRSGEGSAIHPGQLHRGKEAWKSDCGCHQGPDYATVEGRSWRLRVQE